MNERYRVLLLAIFEQAVEDAKGEGLLDTAYRKDSPMARRYRSRIGLEACRWLSANGADYARLLDVGLPLARFYDFIDQRAAYWETYANPHP